MKTQLKHNLIELAILIVVTFLISYWLNVRYSSPPMVGFVTYLGAYIGNMCAAYIISLIIASIYYLITRKFLRIFLNSMWITSGISFLLLSAPY